MPAADPTSHAPLKLKLQRLGWSPPNRLNARPAHCVSSPTVARKPQERTAAFASSERFQCISGGIGINHRANDKGLQLHAAATRRFTPTKCQGDRVRWDKGIELADPDDASDSSIAAMRAAHNTDLGADPASGPGARAGARAGQG